MTGTADSGMPDTLKPIKVILGVDAISYPLTGIGRCTDELARGLMDASGIDARFFSLARWVDDPRELSKPQRVSALVRRNMRSFPFRKTVRSVYHGINRWAFARMVSRLSGFIYHSPNFFLIPFDGPTIVTIYDLSIVHHPDFHPRDRVEFIEREMPKALERADHLIVISDYVKQDIVRTFGYPEERISVTYLGVDPAYRLRTQEEVQDVLKGHGLTFGHYILCVATIEPRKNLSTLLGAFCALPETLQRAFPLVLIGERGWKSEAIHAEIERLSSIGVARYLGYVPETDLPLIYSGARVFVYPSLFEGFGLPVVEAMSSGVPVITTNRTSLPEVAGDAAYLIEPDDVEQMKQLMAQLLKCERDRERMITLGLDQAARFTWPRFVEDTVAVYRKVADVAGL